MHTDTDNIWNNILGRLFIKDCKMHYRIWRKRFEFNVKLCLTVSESIWQYLAVSDVTWQNLIFYGSIWCCLMKTKTIIWAWTSSAYFFILLRACYLMTFKRKIINLLKLSPYIFQTNVMFDKLSLVLVRASAWHNRWTCPSACLPFPISFIDIKQRS